MRLNHTAQIKTSNAIKKGSLKTHSTRFQAASHGLSNYFRCPALNRFSSQEKNVDKQIVIAKYTNATVYSGSS